MSITEIEQILVVPTSRFRELGYFQGFCDTPEKYVQQLMNPEYIEYRPRPEMEEDPSYKQLIPYVIFRFENAEGEIEVFSYCRGKGQGESRLHSKWSIGIGGHISSVDDHDASEAMSPYLEGMKRELVEEVNIAAVYQDRCVGLINDDESEVGRVHLGVVHIFDVESPHVTAREADICEARFRPVSELMADIERFETWSQISLNALF